MLTFKLPFPPSVNTIWRISPTGGNYLSAQGKAFYEAAGRIIRATRFTPFKSTDRLHLKIILCRGDQRRYDIDNLVKGCADSLVRGAVMSDDSQIDTLYVERGPVHKGEGFAVVEIADINEVVINMHYVD